MTTTITIRCPSCHKRFAAPAYAAGTHAKCPECGSQIPIDVPHQPESPPPPPKPISVVITDVQLSVRTMMRLIVTGYIASLALTAIVVVIGFAIGMIVASLGY